MVNLGIPFTFENSSNPWLMDKKDDSDVLVFDGNKYTANYLWTLNKEQRIEALNNIFNHYRQNGFPKIELTDDEIANGFNVLKKYDVKKAISSDGFISNSGTICLDLCKYFSQEFFYDAKGGPKSASVKEIFENDETFIRVLKNRMGWNTSKEDGVERPYLFPISDKQILNGIRNSGLGYGVSNFRPTIGKWMYHKAYELYGIDNKNIKVFDYSGGWCARAMAAFSLGFKYEATDPLTYSCIKECGKKLGFDCNVFDKCSEDLFFRGNNFKERYDIIGSCPPYFDLEIYSDSEKQSTSTCSEYQKWIDVYWKGTVENCYWMLKENGIFILVIKDIVGKHNMKDDMVEVLNNNGLKLIESYQYKTTTNHLSGKIKTNRTRKNNEYVLFFKKI